MNSQNLKTSKSRIVKSIVALLFLTIISISGVSAQSSLSETEIQMNALANRRNALGRVSNDVFTANQKLPAGSWELGKAIANGKREYQIGLIEAEAVEQMNLGFTAEQRTKIADHKQVYKMAIGVYGSIIAKTSYRDDGRQAPSQGNLSLADKYRIYLLALDPLNAEINSLAQELKQNTVSPARSAEIYTRVEQNSLKVLAVDTEVFNSVRREPDTADKTAFSQYLESSIARMKQNLQAVAQSKSKKTAAPESELEKLMREEGITISKEEKAKIEKQSAQMAKGISENSENTTKTVDALKNVKPRSPAENKMLELVLRENDVNNKFRAFKADYAKTADAAQQAALRDRIKTEYQTALTELETAEKQNFNFSSEDKNLLVEIKTNYTKSLDSINNGMITGKPPTAARTSESPQSSVAQSGRQTPDYAAAAVKLTSRIAVTPNDDNLYAQRGMAYLRLKKYDEALADAGKALQINPRSANAYILRGSAKIEKLDYDGAIADLSRAIKAAPRGYPLAYLMRAELYEKKGYLRRAYLDYQQLGELTLNPKAPQGIARLESRMKTEGINPAIAVTEVENKEPITESAETTSERAENETSANASISGDPQIGNTKPAGSQIDPVTKYVAALKKRASEERQRIVAEGVADKARAFAANSSSRLSIDGSINRHFVLFVISDDPTYDTFFYMNGQFMNTPIRMGGYYVTEPYVTKLSDTYNLYAFTMGFNNTNRSVEAEFRGDKAGKVTYMLVQLP